MKQKKSRRILAAAGIILLLAVFCVPMVVALSGDFDIGTFMASIAAVIFIPVMVFVIMQTWHMLKKRRPQPQNTQIENVIFDVGKVLVEFDWPGYLSGFAFAEKTNQRINEAIFGSGDWDERDRGVYEEKDYVDRMVSHAPELETEIREVMRRSVETLSNYDYAETWVKYLKEQGYHLYILSNFSTYLLEQFRPQMGFLKYMDGIIFSCEVRELKPEDGIYRKLLDTFRLDPSKSVFIDDRKENCEGAVRNGISAIQFQSFSQAARGLEERFGVK